MDTKSSHQAKGNQIVLQVGFVLVAALFAAVVVYRLFLGVCFADEAYYAVIARRFVMGDRPFLDEACVQQTATLLVTPFAYMYQHITGGYDGLILFIRFLFLGLTSLVAGVVYTALKGIVNRSLGLATALLCIAYVPAGLPTLSYNTQAYLFFLAATMLGVVGDTAADRWRQGTIFGVSGVASCLSVMSYPTMVIPVLAFLMVVLVRLSYRWCYAVGGYVLGAVLAAVPMLAVFPWKNLGEVIENIGGIHQGARVSMRNGKRVFHDTAIERVFAIFTDLWLWFLPSAAIVVGIVVVAWLIPRHRRTIKGIALSGILIVPLFNITWITWDTAVAYVIQLAIWPLILYPFLKKEHPQLKALLWYVWLPSFVAGHVTAWTSTNGAINAGVGFFPAAIVTIVFIAIGLGDCVGKHSRLSRCLTGAVPACVLLIFVVFQYGFVYSEGGCENLTTRVKSGPCRGLMTTKQKVEFMTMLCEDLGRFKATQGNVLFYDFFPGGYLFTSRRIASNTSWQKRRRGAAQDGRAAIMAHLADPDHESTLVFRMKVGFGFTGGVFPQKYSDDDPLDVYIKSNYRLVAENGYYCIYAQ